MDEVVSRKYLLILCICTVIVINLHSGNLLINSGSKNQSINSPADFKVHDPIHITNNEDLRSKARAENWDLNGTRDGSSNTPFIISNLSISQADERLIRIEGTSLHVTIEKNELSGGELGISLLNTYNIKVSMNHIFNNAWSGILLQGSNTTISNNVIEDNDVGIEMFGHGAALIFENEITRNSWKGIGIEDFEHVKIIRNNVYENGEGLEFLMFTRDTEVYENDIHDNTRCGIFLGDNFLVNITKNRIHHNEMNGIQYEFAFGNSTITDNLIYYNGISGIEILWASNFRIENNSISQHSNYGIGALEDCHNITIIRNNIEYSQNYGLSLTNSTSNNHVSYNNFFVNSITNTAQAFDSGFGNTFIHNFWDDWTIPDDDSDNYVDFPYNIHGEAENSDPYPLSTPYNASSTQSNDTSTEMTSDSFPYLTSSQILPYVFLIALVLYRYRKKRNQY